LPILKPITMNYLLYRRTSIHIDNKICNSLRLESFRTLS
jgi:hypothetical protein